MDRGSERMRKAAREGILNRYPALGKESLENGLIARVSSYRGSMSRRRRFLRWGSVWVLGVIAAWAMSLGGHVAVLGAVVGLVAVTGSLVRGREGLYVVGAVLGLSCLLVGAYPADAGFGDGYGGYCGSVFWPSDAVPGNPEEVTPALLAECGAVRDQRVLITVALGVAAVMALVAAARPRSNGSQPNRRAIVPVGSV
jgi:hypothetical protein